jgi:hypothetical protein
MAEKSGRKYIMSDSVKQFSFLNRWFVFKRKGLAKPIEVPSEPTAVEIVPTIVEEELTTTEEEIPKIELQIDETPKTEEIISKTDARLPDADKKFTESELFRFGSDVPAKDVLKIKDDFAGRWISPTAQFPIPDPDDSSIKYPSIEHYMAGMKLKKASNVPDLAIKLMSSSGSIHQSFLNKRKLEGGIKPGSTRDYQLINDEVTEVRKKMMKTSLQQFRAVINEMKWIEIKDDVLREAIQYRWENDAKFHKIVEAARNQGKYLLYSVKGSSANSELGGTRSITTSQIVGENKVGHVIMEIAGFVF